jgi:hypothetical protein
VGGNGGGCAGAEIGLAPAGTGYNTALNAGYRAAKK